MATDRGLADRPSGDLPATPTKTTWMEGIAGLAALVFLGCWFIIIGFAFLPIIGIPPLSNLAAFRIIQVSIVAGIVALVLSGLNWVVLELRK